MGITFSKTYEKITPESAEQGEVAEHGYFDFGGWQYDIEDPEIAQDVREHPDLYHVPWGEGVFANHILWARDFGICVPSCGGPGGELCEGDHECWWSTLDPHVDYAEGASYSYSLHVSGVTKATRRRIGRLLRGENVFGRKEGANDANG